MELDVRTFCRRALRNHLKEASALAFPTASIEQGLMNLCRILERRNGRHLEAEWLRSWARKWPWFREALAHYWAVDCGFVAIPRLDPEREQERIASCESAVAAVGRNLEKVANELLELRRSREGQQRRDSPK